MAEEKIIVDETAEGFKKFFTTFPRDKENIKLQDKYCFKIQFINAGDMKKIRKLSEEGKTYEAQLEYILKGVKEWNFEEDGKILPITKENVEKLPSSVFSHLALIITAKNRDPSIDELSNIEDF
ncbi:MAG: hypothetical protein GYA14_14070 [Ignavibacteria bacterium]|nr:hypothetical protein [Ignavibacteria bacterium]